MKNTELRIGNIVSVAIGFEIGTRKPLIFGNDPWCVDAIDFNSICVHDFPEYRSTRDVDIEELAGVKLTDEWLLKFGGKNGELIIIDALGYPDSDLYIGKANNGKFYLWNDADGYRFGPEIKYVHQLQNLFFALTGEELTT
jgi:hypothetical protein